MVNSFSNGNEHDIDFTNDHTACHYLLSRSSGFLNARNMAKAFQVVEE